MGLDLHRFRGLSKTENNARKGEHCHEHTRPTRRSFAEKLSGFLEPPTRSIPGIARQIGVCDGTQLGTKGEPRRDRLRPAPYSQGQTEGRVNKLKLIKRSMYERGRFDLSRQRVMYASAT